MPPPAEAAAVKVRMRKSKETAHTWQFSELEEDGKPLQFRTLYVTEEALAVMGRPEEIEVTVTAAK